MLIRRQTASRDCCLSPMDLAGLRGGIGGGLTILLPEADWIILRSSESFDLTDIGAPVSAWLLANGVKELTLNVKAAWGLE